MRSRYSPSHKQKPAADSSWHKVAHWYADHLASGDTYQDTVIFPGAVRLLEPKSNKRYLDIACGEGTFLARLHKQVRTKELVGIDAAPGLIARARDQAKTLPGLRFEIANASSFVGMFAGTRFDGATCLMAIQNIKDMNGVFQCAAELLAPGAPFVIVMNHPCFRIPQQSGWGFDEAENLQYRRMNRYATSYVQPIAAHPGSAPGVQTVSYHRPLSEYVSALQQAGFVIDALEEWNSDRMSDPGPRAKAENKARHEFPLFLALRARKL